MRSPAAQRHATPAPRPPSDSAAATSKRRRAGDGKPGQAAPEALLDAPGQRDRHRQAEPAGQLGRAQPSWQLDQGERVAVGLGHDPVQHRPVEPVGKDGAKQCPGISAAKALEHQLREAPEVIRELSRPEHERHRLRRHAPGHEGKGLRRRSVEPLCVVDDAQHGPLRSRLGQQAEQGQRHQQTVRRAAGGYPEHHLQRVALRLREPLQTAQCRGAKLLQCGERELHLSLMPGGLKNLEAFRRRDGLLDQGRLAHARLPEHHDRPPVGGSGRRQQPVEHSALALPTEQHGSHPLLNSQGQ